MEAGKIEFEVVQIDNPTGLNLIFGTSHFIKTVEDLYEALITSSTCIQFGIGFCEGSGDRLIRWDGNNQDLIELAKKNALVIGAGHSFIVFLDKAFPINVLKSVQHVAEVVTIHCATSNPVQVILAKSTQGKGVMGVIDGQSPLGVEDEEKQAARRAFLRNIGYKK